MRETFNKLVSRGYRLCNYGHGLRYFVKGPLLGKHIVVIVNTKGIIKKIARCN